MKCILVFHVDSLIVDLILKNNKLYLETIQLLGWKQLIITIMKQNN